MASSEREHPRYAHEAVITLHVGGTSLSGRTTNVSRGGVCADLSAEVPMGTDVEVDMQLVFEDDVHSDALRLPARVVWCTTLDDTFQVGLAFKSLAPDKAQYLTMFLSYLDDGAPKGKQPKVEQSVDDQFG